MINYDSRPVYWLVGAKGAPKIDKDGLVVKEVIKEKDNGAKKEMNK